MKIVELWVEIGARIEKFNAGMSQVEKRMATVGKKVTAVGKTMTRYVTLPIVAMGVLAVKAGADFEYAMTNAWAVTGEGEKALAAMTAKAREMGATTVFSAKQAADAMYYMASAGWDTNKMMDAIRPTLALAAATQSELAFSTEAVIASMNQFQIGTKNTQRVVDVFANAIMGSQATLEKLKTSMTFIGPLSHAMGYEIEETTGALMGLYNAGYEASTAGTALRMGLAKLTLGTGATKQGLKNLGLSIEDVNPEMVSMTDIIKKLEERGASAGDVIKIFGVRAGPAFAALIAQGSDALEKNIEKTKKVGSAFEMEAKQIATFKGSFKLLTSIINEASIQIFAVLGPIIKDLVDNKIRPAVKAFTELSDEKKKTILKIIGLVAAAGPLLLIFGKLMIIIPKLVNMTMMLGKALVFLATNPVGILVVALAGLLYMYHKVKSAQKAVTDAAKRENEQIQTQAERWAAVAKAAGLTAKEMMALTREYDGNYSAMFRAIKQGKEGKELQEAYTETIAKLKGEIKEETDALDGLTEAQREAKKKVDDMNEAVKKELELIAKTKDETDAWAERLKVLGVETIPEMEEKITTLTGEIEKLDEMFKTGKIGITDYYNTIRELREEIDRLKEKIEETLPPARDLNDIWELMGPKVEGVKGKLEEAAITIETVGKVFNDAVLSMGENLLNWGNMTGNVLKNITKIFGTFVQETIKGFGKLVIAQLLQAKKSILISKAEAIAKAIAKVFAKIPFPLNIAIAGTMFGVVGALFSKLMPNLEEGGLIPRPMPVMAGHGPKGEIIAQPSTLAKIITQEMPRIASPEMGFAPAMHSQKIIIQNKIIIGEQTFYKESVRSVNKAGELGDLIVPNKVVL